MKVSFSYESQFQHIFHWGKKFFRYFPIICLQGMRCSYALSQKISQIVFSTLTWSISCEKKGSKNKGQKPRMSLLCCRLQES